MYYAAVDYAAPPSYNDHLIHEHQQYITSTNPGNNKPASMTPFDSPSLPPHSHVRRDANKANYTVPPSTIPHLSPLAHQHILPLTSQPDPTLNHGPLTQRPICIPQLLPPSLLAPPPPFILAYPPILTHYNITPTQFLNFLTTLNVAQHPPAPLQAAQLTGNAIGMVPHHWAQLASMGIGAAAGLGGKGLEVARVKGCLEEVNDVGKGLFGRVRLRVRLVDDQELVRLVGVAGVADVDVTDGVVSVVERRMRALAGRVQVLVGEEELVREGWLDDGAAVGSELGWMDRVSGKQVAMKVRKEREKKEKEVWKAAEKEEGQGKEKRRKEKGARKQGKKEREREEKERKTVGRLKWVVITDT